LRKLRAPWSVGRKSVEHGGVDGGWDGACGDVDALSSQKKKDEVRGFRVKGLRGLWQAVLEDRVAPGVDVFEFDPSSALPREDWSFQDVLKRVLLDCSNALDDFAAHLEELVDAEGGEREVLVTVTGALRFEEVIDLLQDELGEETIVWFHALFTEDSSETSMEMLRRRIASFREHVILVDSWILPSFLTDAGCVVSIFGSKSRNTYALAPNGADEEVDEVLASIDLKDEGGELQLDLALCRAMVALELHHLSPESFQEVIRASWDEIVKPRLATLVNQWLVEAVERCVKKKPAREISQQYLVCAGTVMMSMTAVEVAISYFERALEIGPESVLVLDNLSALYSKMDHFERAEKYAERSLMLARTDAESSLVRGILSVVYVKSRHRRHAEANELLMEADGLVANDTSPVGRWRKASISLARSAILYDQCKYLEAHELIESALTTRSTIFGPNHPVIASTLHKLADVLEAMDRRHDALLRINEACTQFRGTLGVNHLSVAWVQRTKASFMRNRGFHTASLKIIDDSIVIVQECLGPKAFPLSSFFMSKANLLIRLRKFSEGLEHYKKAEAIEVEFAKIQGVRPALVYAIANAGRIVCEMNAMERNYDKDKNMENEEEESEAMVLHRESLELELSEKIGSDSRLQVKAILLTKLSRTQAHEGQRVKALIALEKAFELADGIQEGKEDFMTHLKERLGRLHGKLGNLKDALAIFEENLAFREDKFLGGEPNHLVCEALQDIAQVYEHQSQLRRAMRLLERSKNIARKIAGGDPDELLAFSHNMIGNLHFKCNRFARAALEYKISLSIRESLEGPKGLHVGVMQSKIAAMLLRERKYAASLERYNLAEEILLPHIGLRDPKMGEIYVGRGVAKRYMKRLEDALEDLDRGLNIRLPTRGPRDRLVLRAHMIAAGALEELGRHEEALERAKKAAQIGFSETSDQRRRDVYLNQVRRLADVAGRLPNQEKDSSGGADADDEAEVGEEANNNFFP